MVVSPIKWHGGKHYLASRLWEIAREVPHTHRVETHGGSLAFTLASEPVGYSEVVNDLHGALSNFWWVVQNPATFEPFRRFMEAAPFSEAMWRGAQARLQMGCDKPDASGVCSSCAAAFFVVCRQSHAGRMDGFAALSRRRIRRGMNEQVSAWLTSVEGLPEVHARLRRVAILNRHALDVILGQDGPDTLFYCDPPYLPETRVARDAYKHEMSEADHENLLDVLGTIQGKFLLSGYPSPLYEARAKQYGWQRRDFELPNNASSQAEKPRMTESVWANF